MLHTIWPLRHWLIHIIDKSDQHKLLAIHFIFGEGSLCDLISMFLRVIILPRDKKIMREATPRFCVSPISNVIHQTIRGEIEILTSEV